MGDFDEYPSMSYPESPTNQPDNLASGEATVEESQPGKPTSGLSVENTDNNSRIQLPALDLETRANEETGGVSSLPAGAGSSMPALSGGLSSSIKEELETSKRTVEA
mmetsp:Transcript_13505/g.21082  ORF Transcript_13505/g.21082 Transcript_13505/m.21082 type:complete len:107 (+) Transcript_13505:672-992(+)